MAAVTLKDVSKRFGDVMAVDGVSLEARDKEFLVLVGPSGCGKTTTLRLIAGLDDLSGGTISIGERVVNRLSPKDRDIAMVFQSYALYPHMNVFNNMAFGLKMRRTPRPEIQRRVTEAARTLEIENLLKRKPRELSGGQRQRVALGRAIVREPSVFLMDEPLSNLDALLRVQTRRMLVSLHRRVETTVIYVTHDQTEAMTMGSRIAVMNGGRLLQVDEPQTLYDYPMTIFVASFIGSPQMNLVQGELTARDGQTRFQAPDLSLPIPSTIPLDGNQNKTVLGVRPEHLVPVTADDKGASVSAVVEAVEHMGAELYVDLQTGSGSQLTARMPASSMVAPGERLTLGIDVANIHLFDAESGVAIGRGRGLNPPPKKPAAAPS